MKRRITAAVLAAGLALCCCGCSGGGGLTNGDYFKDLTYREYGQYLCDTFISLLPQTLEEREDYGIGSLRYTLGSMDEEVERDKLLSSSTICKSEIPVFYGLLKRAAEYEQQYGVDNTALAEKYGKQHAILADSVEKMVTIIYRREDVPVSHASVDGAEYMAEDKVYVYDELQDPLQEYYDKGWKLLYIPSQDKYHDATWGGDYQDEDHPVILSYKIYWYDETGMLYNANGQEMFRVKNPAEQIKNEENYIHYEEAAGYRPSTDVCITIDIQNQMLAIEPRVTTKETPIFKISVGTGIVSYAG